MPDAIYKYYYYGQSVVSIIGFCFHSPRIPIQLKIKFLLFFSFVICESQNTSDTFKNNKFFEKKKLFSKLRWQHPKKILPQLSQH